MDKSIERIIRRVLEEARAKGRDLRPHDWSSGGDLQNYVQTGINLCTKDIRAVQRAAALTRRATSLGVMVRPWWQEQTM